MSDYKSMILKSISAVTRNIYGFPVADPVADLKPSQICEYEAIGNLLFDRLENIKEIAFLHLSYDDQKSIIKIIDEIYDYVEVLINEEKEN